MSQVAAAPLTAGAQSSCPGKRPQGQLQGNCEPAARAPGSQGRRSSNFALPGRSIMEKEAGHHPVPATHSPREAQKHPALAVTGWRAARAQTSHPYISRLRGTPQTQGCSQPSCQAQDREHGSRRGALSQQKCPWPLLPALQRRCRQLTPHSQSQDSQQSPGKIQGSESQPRMAEKRGTRPSRQGGMTQNQGWGSAGQQPSSVPQPGRQGEGTPVLGAGRREEMQPQHQLKSQRHSQAPPAAPHSACTTALGPVWGRCRKMGLSCSFLQAPG